MEIDLLDKNPRSDRSVDERAALITEERRCAARQFGKEFFNRDRLIWLELSACECQKTRSCIDG